MKLVLDVSIPSASNKGLAKTQDEADEAIASLEPQAKVALFYAVGMLREASVAVNALSAYGFCAQVSIEEGDSDAECDGGDDTNK